MKLLPSYPRFHESDVSADWTIESPSWCQIQDTWILDLRTDRRWIPEGKLTFAVETQLQSDLAEDGPVAEKAVITAKTAGVYYRATVDLSETWRARGVSRCRLQISADALDSRIDLGCRWLNPDGLVIWTAEAITIDIRGTSSFFPVLLTRFPEDWKFLELGLPGLHDKEALEAPWSLVCHLLIDPNKPGWAAFEKLLLTSPSRSDMSHRAFVLAPLLLGLFDWLRDAGDDLIRQVALQEFEPGTFGAFLGSLSAQVPDLRAAHKSPLLLVQAVAASGIFRK